MTEDDIKRNLIVLFLESADKDSEERPVMTELPQSGGERRYFRLSTEDKSLIGTYSPDASESNCFVGLARMFKEEGCKVPQILAVSEDSHFYLQEDLGNASLFSLLSDPDAASLVKKTLRELVKMQKTPEKLWVDACMSDRFCRRQVMWDLNYFKYDFLKPSGIEFDENLLEDDFERLSKKLLDIEEKFCGFMMRDCQSRNVMIKDGEPYFIDFQGGRYGPCLYDAVSFLWQARANFSDEFRKEMMDYYVSAFNADNPELRAEMLRSLDDIVLFRVLQVLGAYGFRGLMQHKAHFILSIPGAIENLNSLMKKGILDQYPELKKICRRLKESEKFKNNRVTEALTIEVFSFSYKKGYPEDMSGNGGGFMFDCRAMHNPGRYKEYKKLTGKDPEVIKFLEDRGEIQSFLRSAWSMTDPAVERYLSRGFTNLQIGFGCTGGQHRSVYCAEATARHLRTLFPEATVMLVHRELRVKS